VKNVTFLKLFGLKKENPIKVILSENDVSVLVDGFNPFEINYYKGEDGLSDANARQR
jgi:hypothetical protein